jgi:hypothetical protein
MSMFPADTTIDHVTIDKSPRLQAMRSKRFCRRRMGSRVVRALSRGQNNPHRRRSRRKTAGPKEHAINDNTLKTA